MYKMNPERDKSDVRRKTIVRHVIVSSQGWELSVNNERRLYLLISDTLGDEGRTADSQKVRPVLVLTVRSMK